MQYRAVGSSRWFHALQWRHNGRDGVSNHQPLDCLLNCLFRHRYKKTSKLRVTGLCAGNSPVTGEFPAQKASNAENVSIWWCHHVCLYCDFLQALNMRFSGYYVAFLSYGKLHCTFLIYLNPSLLNFIQVGKQITIVQFHLCPVSRKHFRKLSTTSCIDILQKKLFYDSQYGFRAKHSTELATVELVDIILHR